ncbi:hypothetical protein MUN81_22485 (plasmid) [Hymenobacter sp. 5317J-9]|uniref:hypothetical protein n=1 Tax=Hymenobacter sp. 5317J-9 TaxID=2932250 RepID=UPI001FD63F9A|nr:hypothetical protein [Hymenobacter sp. 5317J-9]UOR00212.1 hypothetical protein MUN81_22485 [Hymenobacter sp. 5317J-9]
MTFSHWMRATAGLGCLVFALTACNRPEHCEVVPGTRFDGDGVLVLKENTAQDGWTWVTFYPVCHLDTLQLLQALQRAPAGILFQAKHAAVVRAIRHRSVVLLSNNKRYPLPNRRIYVTSAHLAFVDTVRTDGGSPRKPFPYLLDTEQARIEHQVRFVEVRPDAFYGI